ncbi:SIMPL domain-containing protein [Polyangium mundeleinium]|uniref:SIMPL domain-containing protein n=1 Tax=Polyangium mundeleinium TaxID=2995306 RepID=A0ABT5ERE9_9BACT|nr:SIMPL domain-containing protein [Polyangium mundeleinium]MDC0743924.1 SIMPL domain-containing protein [Polyangium mundeleinium]
MTNTTKLFALLATCMMSAVSTPAFSGVPSKSADTEDTDAYTVTVSGLGEVMVAPDSLRTSISIRARAETLAEARAVAGRNTRSVIQALEGLRIQDLQVRTVEITVTPIPERQPEGLGETTEPRIIGYQAESSLSVALRAVGFEALRVQGPRILDAALGAGANVVGGLDFFLSQPREAHRLALAAAVADAEANARVVAGAAKVELRGHRTISTEVVGIFEPQQAMYAAAEMGAGGENVIDFPVEPGEIRVTTQVTASFDFEE